MARNLKYFFEFKNDFEENIHRVEIHVEGFEGSAAELTAGSNPLVISANKDVGEKYLGGIVPMTLNIEAISTNTFLAQEFNVENYGDAAIRYLIDGTVKLNAIIVPFEGQDLDLPPGYFGVKLSAECGLNYLKNRTYQGNGSRKKLITIVKECLDEIPYIDSFGYKVIDNTVNFVGGVNQSINYYDTFINSDNFTGKNCYEVLNSIKQAYSSIFFSEGFWRIRNESELSKLNSIERTYTANLATATNANYLRPTKDIIRNAGGTFGTMFSQKNIIIQKGASVLRNVFEAGNFLDDELWTEHGIFGNLLVIDGKLRNLGFSVNTKNANFVPSGYSNSYRESPSITFYPFNDTFSQGQRQKIKIRIKAVKGLSINNGRIQIIATDSSKGEFNIDEYYYTTEGTWYKAVESKPTPIFDLQINNSEVIIDLNQVPYRPAGINFSELELGEYGFVGNTNQFYTPGTNVPYTLKIRVYFPESTQPSNDIVDYERFKLEYEYIKILNIDDNSEVDKGFNKEFFSDIEADRKKDFTVNLGVGYPSYPNGLDCLFPSVDGLNQINSFGQFGATEGIDIATFISKNYLEVLSTRLKYYQGTVTANLWFHELVLIDNIKHRIHNYSFDVRRKSCNIKVLELANSSINVDSIDFELSEEIKREIDEQIRLNLGGLQSLKFNDINFEGNILPDGQLNIGLRKNLNISSVRGNEVFLKASSGGFIRDISEDTANDYTLIKPAENGTYATREWVGDELADSTWLLSGNTLTASATLGSLNNHNVVFKRNNLDFFSLTTEGIESNVDYISSGNIELTKGHPRIRLHDTAGSVHTSGFDIQVVGDEFTLHDRTHDIDLIKSSLVSTAHHLSIESDIINVLGKLTVSNVDAATTDTDKFLVLDTTSVKFRTGTQLLSDIGGFATPTGLTTGALTKWNGTTLVDAIQSDLTTLLAGSYIVNGTTQQASSNFNISGTGTFGGQIIASAGSVGSPSISRLGDLNTGVFFPSDDAMALVTGGVNRLHINNVGSVGIGTTSFGGYNLRVSKNITGAAVSFGIASDAIVQNDVTTAAYGFFSSLSASSSVSPIILLNFIHNRVVQGTIGTNVTVGSQFGYWVDSTLIGANSNYGFRGSIPSGLNRWNAFMDGTAQNHFRGNVGIGAGSTVPATELEVRGQISANAGTLANPSYSFVGDLNTGVYSPGADALAVVTGGFNRLHINSSGNVGIGTNAPLRRLDVVDLTGAFFRHSTTANTAGVFRIIGGSFTGIGVTGLVFNAIDSNNQLQFGGGSSLNEPATNLLFFTGTYGSAGAGMERMRINNAGNVGINTTVPTDLLHVNGTSRTTNLKITNGAIVGRYWVCTNADGTGAWTALGSSGYLGTWNANTNTPTIANGTGTAGTFYIVSVAGTWNGITFAQNDQVWYNGTTWQHVPTGISLPIASASVLGGVRIGSGLSIDGSGVLSVGTLNQNTTGSAATLTTSRNIAITGDVAWNVDFNGSANVTAAGTLATVNANIGEFTKLTVNAKGLVTAATNLVESDIPSLSISKITNLQTTLDGLVINGLGFVKADGTTLSYDNREFVDTASDQTGIAGKKRFSDEISIGSSVKSILRLEVVGTGTTPNSLSSNTNGAMFISASTNGTGLALGVFEDFGFAGNTSISYFQARNRTGTGQSWNISLNPLGGNVGIGLLSAQERLQVSGNIRYSGTLRPNGSQGTSGQFLRNNGSGVVDSWANIGHADISNLSTYTGFDSRYAPISSSINGTGFVKASGTTISYDNREFVDLTTNQTVAGVKTFSSDGFFNGVRIGNGPGTGANNTAIGEFSLNSKTTGFANVAVGYLSLQANTTGSLNTALGIFSGMLNTTGINNVVIGAYSLYNNTTGSNNVAVGFNSGRYLGNGSSSNTTPSDSIFLGFNTRSLAINQTNQIVIGNQAIGNGSNTVTIGNSSVTDNFFNGSLKYGTLLKPNNVAGTNGQFLRTNGTQDAWATIGHADITNLASFTGFDSRYLQANQTITLTGEVTGSGTTSIATTIANNAVVTAKVNNSAITYAKIQNVAADRILGRLSTLGVVQELTSGQVKTFLAIGHADISNLSTYTGFDSRYSPIIHNHTLDSLSNVTITNKATGNFTRWNGTAWVNTNLVAADIPNLSTDKLTSGVLPISRGGTGRDTVGTAGQLVRVNSFANGLEYFTHNFTSNLGTVTSVGLSAPTGFVVANTPVTTSGVLTLNFAAGYSLPLTSKQTQWDAAFGWGNHAGLYSLLDHVHTFASLTSKPNTIAGYGITDYNSLWDTRFATRSTTNLVEGTNLYFTNTRARQAISLTTLGTSGAANYNNTTGVLNVPNYTLAGLGGEPLFSKNTAFNKNFGTTAGTVAEGNHVHTIGQITNLQSSLDAKQSILPTGTAAQLLTWDGVGHNYMNLELKTHFLRRNRIAVGNDYNSLDSHSEFTYDGYGTINIYRGGDFSRIASFGLIYGTNNSLLKATGGDLILSGNNIRINNFANATTTRMVVVDGNGFLSTQAIPTGGGGTTTPTLDIVASQTTGQFSSQLISTSGAGYMFRNDSISQSLSGMNLTNGDLQIIAFENRKLELTGHTEVRISNFSNNNNKLRIDTTVVDHKGTIYRFDKQSAFNGDYTPQTGDKVLFTFNGTEFVQQKINTYVAGDGRTYLIL